MRNWLSVAVMAMAAALVGCAADGNRTMVKADALDRAGLQYYWQECLPLKSGERVMSAHLFQDQPNKTWVIYYLTSYKRVICYDAMVGTERWTASLVDNGMVVYPPTQGPDVSITKKPMGIAGLVPEHGKPLDTITFHPVAINTESTIFLFDRTTGQEYRQIPAHAALTAGGCMDGQFFIVPSAENGAYLAFAFQEGVPANWKGSTGGTIKAAPVYKDDHVFVGGSTGEFHCAIVGAGFEAKLEWQKKLTRGILASPAVDTLACLVPVEDGRLYNFDAKTGAPLWTRPFTTEQPLTTSPQVSPFTVFQYSQGDRFYAIDKKLGTKLWDNRAAKTVLSVIKSDVYAVDLCNNLLVIDNAKGTVKHTIPMTGFSIYAANTAYPGIFVANSHGRVACIRTSDAGRITPEILTSSQPAR